MKASPPRRELLRVGTERALRDARSSIDMLRAASPTHLNGAARQVADLAEHHLAAAGALAPHTGEANAVAHNLARALRCAEAVLHAPDDWAGMSAIAEALQLLGIAQAQALACARLGEQRSKGGRKTAPASKAEMIRKADADRPAASSGAIAAAVNADPRHVRRVRAKR